MMNNIEIKRATSNDVTVLQQISKQTFFETFSSYNSTENMTKYMEEGFSIEKLSAELQHESVFYLAMDDKTVAGYLKINTGQSQTELKGPDGLEIERIYVLQQYQGKKLGQLLYEKAIQVAKANQKKYVWLGVWEENRKAIRFYNKNGFVEFDKHIFKLGNDEQTDIMMKKDLL